MVFVLSSFAACESSDRQIHSGPGYANESSVLSEKNRSEQHVAHDVSNRAECK